MFYVFSVAYLMHNRLDNAYITKVLIKISEYLQSLADAPHGRLLDHSQKLQTEIRLFSFVCDGIHHNLNLRTHL